MNKNLIYFIIFCMLDLLVLQVSSQHLVISVIESDIWGTLIFSLLFSITGDSFINRCGNFSKYYPNFEDKWLNFF